MGLNIEKIQELLDLVEKKKNLNMELKDTQERINQLEPWVVDHLAENDVDGLKLNGKSIYVQHRVFTKVIGSKDEAIRALKEAGLDEYVAENFNRRSLDGYIGELIKNGEELPPEFEERIGFSEDFKVGVRKA